MKSDADDLPPPWKIFLVSIGTILVWPLLVAPRLWRARRYQLAASRARGWKHRLVPDGVEVWRGDDAPRSLSWETLHRGAWFSHFSPTMASGDEELLAVDLPEQHLALAGWAGDLQPLLNALATREMSPRVQDGGRGLGAAGWLLSMVWLGVALTALLVYL